MQCKERVIVMYARGAITGVTKFYIQLTLKKSRKNIFTFAYVKSFTIAFLGFLLLFFILVDVLEPWMFLPFFNNFLLW